MDTLKKFQSLSKMKKFVISMGVLISLKIYKKCQQNRKQKRIQQSLNEIQQNVQTERDQKIQAFLQKYLTSVQEDTQKLILFCTATELMDHMKNNSITSEQIVITYCIQICKIGIIKKYIADFDFEQAIADAQEKDKERKEKKGQNLPPLHGLPIGIKDHLPVKGLLCTTGLIARAAKKQEQDCTYVAALRRQGAVILCMTTLPQFSLHFTCESHIWGVAENPYNSDFSTGGSSGGSAGGVASKCMPISIGSDLAGSIRLPAAFCGVYSFKPSNLRISKRGVMGAQLDGDLNNDRDVGTSLGPIGRNTNDLILISKSVYGQFFEDPLKNPQPWDDQVFQNFKTDQLTIGYVEDCADYPFVAPVKNVMQQVIQDLKNQGHKMVPFDFEQFWELDLLSKKLMMAKNLGKLLHEGLQGEEPMVWMKKMLDFYKLPYSAQCLISWLLLRKGEVYLAKIAKSKQSIPYHEACELQKQFDKLTYKFVDYWRSLNIDLLVLPIAQYFTLKHGEDSMGGAPSYLYVTNALKLPVGSVPIRLATEEEQTYKVNVNDTNMIRKAIAKTVINCKGLPISIQVAALPFEDEKCLKGMQVVENIYKFYNLPK